jgi:hypothetical protein
VTVAAGAATLHKNGSSTTSLGGLVNGPVVPGSYLMVSGPQHGTAHLSADGVLTYAPDTGYTGTDSIIFSVRGRDGKRYSATYVFTVRPDTLSFTGAPIDAFGGGGAAAVALGLLLIVAARRRHEDEQLA